MTAHEHRKINKFNLATNGSDEHNRFDYTADQTIDKLKKDNEKAIEDYNLFEKMEKENASKWRDLQERASQIDIDLYGQQNSFMMDLVYRTEEMGAIMEMKIIYAYKHLEILTKKLIIKAYPEVSTKDFYNWESLLTFLKSKEILPNSLEGFNEVDQLRIVNNAVKHSQDIQKKLLHINEFAGVEYVSFEQLEKFYIRVKEAPKKYLKDLASKIYSQLYEFDNNKLQKMADDLVLRLDKENALLLANMIRTSYE